MPQQQQQQQQQHAGKRVILNNAQAFDETEQQMIQQQLQQLSESQQRFERRNALQNNVKTFAFYNGLYDSLFDDQIAADGDDDDSSSGDESIMNSPALIQSKRENEMFETLLNDVKSILSGLDGRGASCPTQGSRKS